MGLYGSVKNMPFLNLEPGQNDLYENYETCIPIDPETGCRACGDNARIDYEQCRQTYFLKQQNQILQSQQTQQSSQDTTEQKGQENKALEAKNQELQKQIDLFNKKVTTQDILSQTSDKEISTFVYFFESITESNILNIVFYLIFTAAILSYLLYKKMKKIKCSQCRYLKKGEGIEKYINPQGISTNIHQGRFYCNADISRRFTDEQIQEFKRCSYFRLKTLTFWQDLKQKFISLVSLCVSLFK